MGGACGGCRCCDGLVLFASNFRKSCIGERSYWDAAYASGLYQDQYEWLQTSAELWPHIQRALDGQAQARVLHVGCGNSELGKDVANAGHDVVNVDYSSVVIEAMRRKHPDLVWIQADCAEQGALGLDGAYDVCIDKGALDALLESGSQYMLDQARRMVAEIHRVLRPGGRYLLFSNDGSKRHEVLDKHFQRIEYECREGYSMDLYQKFMYVFLATK